MAVCLKVLFGVEKLFKEVNITFKLADSQKHKLNTFTNIALNNLGC